MVGNLEGSWFIRPEAYVSSKLCEFISSSTLRNLSYPKFEFSRKARILRPRKILPQVSRRRACTFRSNDWLKLEPDPRFM